MALAIAGGRPTTTSSKAGSANARTPLSPSSRPGTMQMTGTMGSMGGTGRLVARPGTRGSMHSHDSTNQDPTAGQWSTPWRPAPAHLVDEWRSLGNTAKGAVMQLREDIEKGDLGASIGNCSLGDPGALVLAEALLQGNRLRNINLINNGIGDSGIIQLAEAFEQTSTLEVICVSSNKVGDAGASRLASLLECHMTVRALDLSSNFVGDVGARKLVSALCGNPRHDIAVVLTNNPVKRMGYKALQNLQAVAATVNRLSTQGVTVGQLLWILNDGIKAGWLFPRETTTGDVCQRLLIPESAKAIKNYVQAVSPGNAQPMVQVIHAWDALFEDLVHSVAAHAKGRREVPTLDPTHHEWCYEPDKMAKSYFIDAFCVNQHAHVNARQQRELARFVDHPAYSLGDPGNEIDKLDLVATKIHQRGGKALLVVDIDNQILTRAHCLHELHAALAAGIEVDVRFAGVRIFPRNKRGSLLQNAQACSDHTRNAILEDARDGPGGFDKFNETVMEFIDRHVDREFDAVLDQVEAKLTY